METTMTLSHLADMIIVISFFSIIGATIGHVLGELICLIADSIREKLKKRKERHDKDARYPLWRSKGEDKETATPEDVFNWWMELNV